jgi:hypothetical protein
VTRASTDGVTAAPATPEQRTADDEHLRACGKCRRYGGDAKHDGTDEQQFLPADPVTDGAHGDQEARDQEALDIHDPQLLDAARREVGGQVRNGQDSSMLTSADDVSDVVPTTISPENSVNLHRTRLIRCRTEKPTQE